MILFFALLQDDAAVARAVVDQLDRAVVLYVEKHGAPPKALDDLKAILLTDRIPAVAYAVTPDAFTLEASPLKRTSPLKGFARRGRTDDECFAAMVEAAVHAFHDLHGKLPSEVPALAGRGILVDADRLKRVGIEPKEGGARITITHLTEPPDEAAFAGQIRLLRDDDAAKRDAAVEAIGAMGPGAIPAVERAAAAEADPDVGARLRTIRDALIRRRDGPAFVEWVFTKANVASNERRAVAKLRSYNVAQANFHANDLDENMWNDYWTGDIAGLYCIQVTSTGNAIAALDAGIASADAARITIPVENTQVKYNADLLQDFWPSSGYLFQTLKNDSAGMPYARSTFSGPPVNNDTAFGAVAYPAEYGVTGRHTYITNENSDIFRRDTGGKPVENHPTAVEMSRDWEKLR